MSIALLASQNSKKGSGKTRYTTKKGPEGPFFVVYRLTTAELLIFLLAKRARLTDFKNPLQPILQLQQRILQEPSDPCIIIPVATCA